jgi:hypothetical protein
MKPCSREGDRVTVFQDRGRGCDDCLERDLFRVQRRNQDSCDHSNANQHASCTATVAFFGEFLHVTTWLPRGLKPDPVANFYCRPRPAPPALRLHLRSARSIRFGTALHSSSENRPCHFSGSSIAYSGRIHALPPRGPRVVHERRENAGSSLATAGKVCKCCRSGVAATRSRHAIPWVLHALAGNHGNNAIALQLCAKMLEIPSTSSGQALRLHQLKMTLLGFPQTSRVTDRFWQFPPAPTILDKACRTRFQD